MKKCKKVWDEFKSAQKNGQPLDVIDKIIEQNLLVLEQRFGPLGFTPLNLACYYAASSGEYIIERLIERCPKALTLTDNKGRLPLHYIIGSSRNVTLDLVQLFVHNFPDSVKAKTNNNLTPLHLAAESQCALDVIQFLCEQYPGAVLDQDKYGGTPLHYASLCTHRREVLRTVYHPRAARMQAQNYFTPFHLAYENGNDTAIQFLLERDPVLLVEIHLRNKLERENFARNKYAQNAALALVGELVYTHTKSPSKMEPNVMAKHLAKLLEARQFPTLQQLHSPKTQNALRVCLTSQMCEELEAMLYEPTFRELLKVHRFMIRINQSGYLRDDLGNKAKYIAVLAFATSSVNDNNDCKNSDDDSDFNSGDDSGDDDLSNSDDDDNNSDDDDNNSDNDDNNNADDYDNSEEDIENYSLVDDNDYYSVDDNNSEDDNDNYRVDNNNSDDDNHGENDNNRDDDNNNSDDNDDNNSDDDNNSSDNNNNSEDDIENYSLVNDNDYYSVDDNNSEDDNDDYRVDNNNSDDDNHGDNDNNNSDNDNHGDNDNNSDNDNSNNKDNNSYSNVTLLFQILCANTLLCNRLPSPLLF